jgi:hypothetical protein
MADMRTDDLIRVLASDQPVPHRSTAGWMTLCVPIGFVVSAALFSLALGPRDDIASAAITPRFVLKVVEMLLLAGAAAVLALRLARPAASLRGAALLVLGAVMLPLLAATLELLLVPSAQWSAKLVGSNSRICLTAIPVLSLPLLASALYVLRHGAPTAPGFAGAVAGVLAGAAAAILYALHCTDDSPLFVVTWYSLAIVGVSLLGWALGRYALRW